MAIDQVVNRPWTRKHDMPGVPLIPSAPKIIYPKSLEELISICKTRKPNEHLRAAGSHWALSQAAISDRVFVETHDPANTHRAMGRTLREVVPDCLSKQFLNALNNQAPTFFDDDPHHVGVNSGFYPVHFETGKRVYQLYAELDIGEEGDPKSLARFMDDHFQNRNFFGPWAFPTLGGAGGQTVFGALNTGTHGGDIHMGPIADAVMAIHLVVDGGRHYWIEPTVTAIEAPLTDRDAVIALYGAAKYGGPENFAFIRDDDLFRAVVVSTGRFGIVYSIVMRAVRQYCLHEERRLTNWQAIKSLVSDTTSFLYQQRFLQIAICLTPYDFFRKNLAGITRRWNAPISPPGSTSPDGRDERRGKIVNKFDPMIQGPRFDKAGNSFAYSPDENDPHKASDPSFLEKACTNADFMEGVVDEIIQEIEGLVEDNALPIAGGIAAVGALGGAGAVASLFPPLLAILALLAIFLAALRASGDHRLGQVMNDLKNTLLNSPDPAQRAAGLLIWQAIAYKVFSGEQKNLDYEAISYAIMDRHDYFDQSCNVNVDSIEVFFDATDPMLIAFVDALLVYEIMQEFNGKAFVGYISLRFTGQTTATIGMEMWPASCAVEIAGLKDVDGTVQLIDYAVSLSRNRNFAGILHWGQRNDSSMDDIQFRFGDSPSAPSGPLHDWRDQLARVTQNGRRDGFTSEFSRRVGLEIVTPLIRLLASNTPGATVGQTVTLSWDCSDNPPGAEVRLVLKKPSGPQLIFSPLPHVGVQGLVVAETGTYTAKLTATIRLNGQARRVSRLVSIAVV